MKRRPDLKDYLEELDIILHDNSVEAQAFQSKVLDLVHHPTQYPHPVDPTVGITETTENSLQGILNRMAEEPQGDDIEPRLGNREWISVGPRISLWDGEDFVRWGAVYGSVRYIADMAVDGIRYRPRKNCPFFTTRDC